MREASAEQPDWAKKWGGNVSDCGVEASFVRLFVWVLEASCVWCMQRFVDANLAYQEGFDLPSLLHLVTYSPTTSPPPHNLQALHGSSSCSSRSRSRSSTRPCYPTAAQRGVFSEKWRRNPSTTTAATLWFLQAGGGRRRRRGRGRRGVTRARRESVGPMAEAGKDMPRGHARLYHGHFDRRFHHSDRQPTLRFAPLPPRFHPRPTRRPTCPGVRRRLPSRLWGHVHISLRTG